MNWKSGSIKRSEKSSCYHEHNNKHGAGRGHEPLEKVAKEEEVDWRKEEETPPSRLIRLNLLHAVRNAADHQKHAVV